MAGNFFKQWMNHYLNFSKKDRNAVVTLCILIFLVLLAHIVVNRIEVTSNLDREKAELAIREWERARQNNKARLFLFNFDPNTISSQKLDSLSMPAFVKQNIINYREAGGRFEEPADIRKIYGMTDSIFEAVRDYIVISENETIVGDSNVTKKIPQESTGFFDPNTAEMDTLLIFGFNNFQASNLIKYRASGGFINTPEDIFKIYGVDTPFFQTIKDHISINGVSKTTSGNNSNAELISIELNSASAEQLEMLRGIGPVFAERIVKFRELLGGFYSQTQLLEVYNLPEETYHSIENQLSIDTSMINQMRLNFAEYSDLLRHPYLEQEEVEKILNYRQENGPFNSIQELLSAGLIDRESFNKVRHYLSCR